MSEGTVALTPENAVASYFAAQKELREVYARVAKFHRAFEKYAKRQYNDANVLRPALDELLGFDSNPGADHGTK